jgi:saccharopine dehydrogenase (NAD+, L-lysine forming)
MNRVLIIGAGGVGNVVTRKCAEVPEVFSDIMLASRTKSKCDKIGAEIKGKKIQTAEIDADNIPALVQLIKSFKPALVINVALPYQDLTIMEACLETKTHYLDTANYEPLDEAKFEYSWQWAYQDRFKKAGITGILGCGFDPGVTGVFTKYAAKHHFDEIHYLDIVDCNAGNHGKAFATNFNPEINIREITQKGKYWKDGKWLETAPLSIHQPVDYPEVGPKESYLMYHEELESLVKNFPALKQARFWMTFSENYLTHLRVLENIGMTSIKPVNYEGHDIVPLKFLKALLPDPSSLAQNYSGKTSIGCQIRGIKDGKEKTYFIYNNCDHALCFNECNAQAVSYTTGVPAMVGALMLLTKKWEGAGVYNVEEFNPDPFLESLAKHGLPWHEKVNGKLSFDPS